MRRLSLIALVLCGTALAQGIPPAGGGLPTSPSVTGSYTSTAASGQKAFIQSTGAFFCLDGSTCNDYLKDVGGVTTLQYLNAQQYISTGTVTGPTTLALTSNAADGSSAVGITLSNSNAMANAGARPLKLKNATTLIWDVGPSGTLFMPGVASGDYLLKGNQGSVICLNMDNGSPCTSNIREDGFGTLNLKGRFGVTLDTGSNSAAFNIYEGTLAVDNSYAHGVNIVGTPGGSGPVTFTATGTDTAMNFVSTAADGASALGYKFNTSINLLNASAKLVSFQNNSVEMSYVDGSGNYVGNLQASFIFGNGTSSMTIRPSAADGASAIGTIIQNSTTLTTAGAKLVSFKNNSTEKAYIDKDGVVSTGGLLCAGSTHCGTITLSAATSGTATVVSGCHPMCTDTTTATAVKCAVSSTTLTASMLVASSDAINYFCF